MMGPAALAMAVAKYGPAAYGVLSSLLGNHNHEVDWNAIQNWMATQHAEGTLSQPDMAAADATQSRLNAGAEVNAQGQRMALGTRLEQRGIASAPAAEAGYSRVAESLARARQAAGDTAEEQRYNIWLGNKNFQQQQIAALTQGRINDAISRAGRGRAADAGLVNATTGLVGSLARGTPQTTTGSTDPGTPAGDPGSTTTDTASATPVASARLAARRRGFNAATGTYGILPDYSQGRSAYAAGVA